jgi:hypothetical protein
MKRFNWLLISLVIFCLAVIPFAGCGTRCEYRDFSSLSELQEWLRANDVSERPDTQYAEDWYGKALEIQEDALEDGYIISADYDYDEETETYAVYCVTIINGRVFWWDPETDDVYEEYGLGTVK